MSNYGVLVVECEGSYQIVAAVSSRAEALEMAANYCDTAQDDDNLAPEAFVVNRRGANGFYNVREVLADEDIFEYADCLAAIRRLQAPSRGFGLTEAQANKLYADCANYQARLAVLGGAR